MLGLLLHVARHLKKLDLNLSFNKSAQACEIQNAPQKARKLMACRSLAMSKEAYGSIKISILEGATLEWRTVVPTVRILANTTAIAGPINRLHQ